jgi:hypothetical protein
MSFIYDGNMTSPQELAKQRALYEAMLQRGGAPASSIGEGLAVLGQAFAGRMGLNKVKKLEAKNLAGANGIAKAFMSRGQGAPVAAATPAAPVNAKTPAVAPDIATGIQTSAKALGIDPVDLATAISYETAGTFDPAKAGPRTQWGQHKGLIQFGEPQAKQYGVNWDDPVNSQLGDNGAVVKYLKAAGVKPGMGMMDVYSAINAGRVGKYGASDANNGGAPGTVADKVNNQMAGHRAKAMALFGNKAPQMAPAPTAMNNGDYLQQFGIKSNNPGLMDQEVVPTSGPSPAANPQGIQPGLSAPGMGFQPQPGISSPQMPAQAPQMAPQPASQIATGGAMPMPQKPMTAYQRMTQTSLGKEAGGLAAPPNRTLMASVMGQGAQQLGNAPNISPPQSIQPTSGETAAMPAMAPGMASPAASPAAGGSRLAELESYIFDPYFSVLQETNPAAANVIMKQYEQEYARANTVPEQPKPTDDMREFELAQKDPAFRQYLQDMKKAGASSVVLNNGSEVGTIPQGFELFTDPKTGARSMRPIPGGPAAAEADVLANKNKLAKQSQADAADIVTQDIDRTLEILDQDSWYNPATGIGSGMAGSVPGSNSANIQALLGTIGANIAFDKLQAMRAASPTGGALGAVSDTEMGLLKSAYGAVGQSQSEDQLRFNLNRLWNTYQDVIHGKGGGPERRKLGKDLDPSTPPTLAPSTPNDLKSKYGLE